MKTLKNIVLLAAWVAGSAQAQDVAPIISTFALTTTNFAASASSNYTIVPAYSGQAVTLKPHNGMAIVASAAGAAGSAAALSFKYDLSADNVSWTTTMPLTNSMTLNGTNIITSYTLFPDSTLNHMRYIRLAQIVNANAQIIQLLSLKLVYFNAPK